MPLSDLLSALGALALVIGLIVLLRFGTRFVGPVRTRAQSASLLVISRLALDSRRRLCLVETEAGQVLVLTGGATDMMLAWPPRTENQA